MLIRAFTTNLAIYFLYTALSFFIYRFLYTLVLNTAPFDLFPCRRTRIACFILFAKSESSRSAPLCKKELSTFLTEGLFFCFTHNKRHKKTENKISDFFMLFCGKSAVNRLIALLLLKFRFFIAFLRESAVNRPIGAFFVFFCQAKTLAQTARQNQYLTLYNISA